MGRPLPNFLRASENFTTVSSVENHLVPAGTRMGAGRGLKTTEHSRESGAITRIGARIIATSADIMALRSLRSLANSFSTIFRVSPRSLR
jgi:hypothetical protein